MDTRRPSHLLGFLLVSSANAAGKILASLESSSAAARRDGERWKAADHLRHMMMLTLWMMIWILWILMDFLSLLGILPSDPVRGAFIESKSYSDSSSRDLAIHSAFRKSPDRAIGRSLSHVLSLINDVPATARKYDLVVSTAERILDDNAHSGSWTLQQINRTALSSAFSRTSEKLRVSLQASRDSEDAFAKWPLRFLQRLPLGYLLAAYFAGTFNLLFPTVDSLSNRPLRNREEIDQRSKGLESEKLAQELLWIVNKMRTCEALDEALLNWSLAGGLSSLSLTANPRSQGALIKVSVLLLRQIAKWADGVPREVRFKILAMWMPLFCHAGNVAGPPGLAEWEKRETEAIVEEIILGLPWEDQELILRNWMEDFIFSASDWPDLRACYDRWCHSSRRLLDSTTEAW